MSPDNKEDLEALAESLDPLTSRMRQDVTACKSLNGSVYRSHESFTLERLVSHINGGVARGLYFQEPEQDTVLVGALDFDDHKRKLSWDQLKAAAALVLPSLYERGFKPHVFKSSSGHGIHMWFIWPTSQDAWSVRVALRGAIQAVGFTDGTRGVELKQIEVFPKNNRVSKDKYGFQMFLPLAGGGVPLDLKGDRAGFLGDLKKIDALGMEWEFSAPVRKVAPPVKKSLEKTGGDVDLERYRSMLSFIKFDAGEDYSYKTWLDIGFGIHYATDGSDKGLDLWDEWSSLGSGYGEEGREKCEAKWETMDADNGAGDREVITGGTVEYMARQWGWQDDLSGDFEDLTGEEPTAQSLLFGAAVAEDRKKHDFQPDVVRDGPENVLLFTDMTDWSAIAEKVHERLFMADGATLSIFSKGLWYLYRDHCWQIVERIVIEKKIDDLLNRAYVVNTKKGNRKERFKPASRHMSEIMRKMERLCLVERLEAPMWLEGAERALGEDERSDARDLIRMKNGLLDVSREVLLPHTPWFFSLNVLPFPWDENAKCPQFEAFVESVWPGEEGRESRECLQEMSGYMCANDTSQQKLFLLYGPGRSGKGTIARVLKALVGERNVASTSLSVLSSRFGLENLIDKLVAVLPDARNLSSRGAQMQVAVERLLSISGEDYVLVEQKHVEPWDGKIPARVLILSNEMIAPGDSSEVLAKRFIILRTSVSFYGREDTGLTDRLLGELPGILRWALVGLRRLRERGRFVPPLESADSYDEMMDANNPVRRFLGDFVAAWRWEEGESLRAGLLGLEVDAFDGERWAYGEAGMFCTISEAAALAGAVGRPCSLAGEGGLVCLRFDYVYERYVVWCRREGLQGAVSKVLFAKGVKGAFDGRVAVNRRSLLGSGGVKIRTIEGLEKL